jgi:hypothetical protein
MKGRNRRKGIRETQDINDKVKDERKINTKKGLKIFQDNFHIFSN